MAIADELIRSQPRPRSLLMDCPCAGQGARDPVPRHLAKVISAVLALVLAGLLEATGCASSIGRPVNSVATVPMAIHRIAVLAPENLTGDDLLITDISALERYAFHSERVTVADALAAYARAELALQAFEVVDPLIVERATEGRAPGSPRAAVELLRAAKLDAMAMVIQIRRWSPEATVEVSAVIVDLDIMLIDPETGMVFWEARHPTRPEQVHAPLLRGEAYTIIAEKLIREMLAPLGPERSDQGGFRR